MTEMQNDAKSSHPIMETPLCTDCATTMSQCRVEPHEEGSDIRTFECSLCRNTTQFIVDANTGFWRPANVANESGN